MWVFAVKRCAGRCEMPPQLGFQCFPTPQPVNSSPLLPLLIHYEPCGGGCQAEPHHCFWIIEHAVGHCLIRQNLDPRQPTLGDAPFIISDAQGFLPPIPVSSSDGVLGGGHQKNQWLQIPCLPGQLDYIQLETPVSWENVNSLDWDGCAKIQTTGLPFEQIVTRLTQSGAPGPTAPPCWT